jgi:hypothetical protein
MPNVECRLPNEKEKTKASIAARKRKGRKEQMRALK